MQIYNVLPFSPGSFMLILLLSCTISQPYQSLEEISGKDGNISPTFTGTSLLWSMLSNGNAEKTAATNLLFGELRFFGDILQLFVQMV